MRLIQSLIVASLAHQLHAIKNIRFASPLQTLTISEHDDGVEASTPRSRYLSKLPAALKAEAEVREQMEEDSVQVDKSDPNWAQSMFAATRRLVQRQELAAEAAFDRAMKSGTDVPTKGKSKHKYQIVGVIQPSGAKKPIVWYARPKPSDSNWSVRLVHVNRDAILKDMFNQGKVDVFGRYRNTGKKSEETGMPVVKSEYSVRQRSWKNLWNFSPKHFFTDSSGMYWRERRLPEGLYTDGVSVFETSYRYRDGRNGMHRVSSYEQFLRSPLFSDKQKLAVQKKLKAESPDVVLEE